MAEKVDADILIYGHVHRPYRKDFSGKVFINAGSVGKPKDGDLSSSGTVVEIMNGIVSVKFLRVPYDVQKTAQSIVSSGLPSYFAEKLKEGR
jgi:predicted phosphodiesterase